MPYFCTLVGSKWNLHKKDSSDSLGTHPTKKACIQQMRAVYSQESRNPKNIIFDGPISSPPSDFDQKLKESDKEVNVTVNSQGGDFFEAVSVFNKLRNSGKRIKVHISPFAMSAGAVIALAGDEIIMPENGLMMFHVPKVEIFGIKDAEQLEKLSAALRASEEVLINIIMSKTKKSKEECEQLMRNDTWLTADEARNLGIVNEIIPIVHEIQNVQGFQMPERVINFLKEKNEMPLKEICDQFNVKDETELINLITELRKNQIPKTMEVAPSLLNMIKKARESELDTLVSTGKVIPAVINELKTKFITDERIKTDASSGNQEFEHIINALSKNEEVISFKGKTGVQNLGKGSGTETDDDVCVRLMEAKKKKLQTQ